MLDEIEAALDDVNVYRFADYLKQFAKQTQFLIITHRKGTMEVADTVYGITTVSYTHLDVYKRQSLCYLEGCLNLDKWYNNY